MDRQTGKLRIYFGERGFGFIESDQLGESVFVHARDLERAAIPTPPATGTHFEFRIEKTVKGPQARNLRLVPRGTD